MARADVRLVSRNGRGALRLGPMQLDTASGARLALAGGEGLTYAWPNGALGLDGEFSLSGGGFPDARFTLRQEGSAIRGSGRIAPMQAGGARLALGEIAFTAGADGRTRFRTVAQLDGPFNGGRVAGLTLPLTGRFGRGGFGRRGCGSELRARRENLRIGPSRLGRPGREWCQAGSRRAACLADGRLVPAYCMVRPAEGRSAVSSFGALVRLGGAQNKLDLAQPYGRFGARGGVGGASPAYWRSPTCRCGQRGGGLADAGRQFSLAGGTVYDKRIRRASRASRGSSG